MGFTELELIDEENKIFLLKINRPLVKKHLIKQLFNN